MGENVEHIEGDRVLIETTKNCSDILKYMIQKISEKGAIPFVMFNETDIKRELIKNGTAEQFQLMKKHHKASTIIKSF